MFINSVQWWAVARRPVPVRRLPSVAPAGCIPSRPIGLDHVEQQSGNEDGLHEKMKHVETLPGALKSALKISRHI